MEIVYKCIVIVTGIVLLILNLRNIAKKKMDIGIGSWWTIMAIIVVVFGAVFDFNSLLRMVNVRNLTLIYLLAVSLMVALYLYGMHITQLKKRSEELAMWVSLARSLKEKQEAAEQKGDGGEENSEAAD